MTAGERVTDQYGVAGFRIQFTIGLIDQLESGQRGAALQ